MFLQQPVLDVGRPVTMVSPLESELDRRAMACHGAF